MKIPNFFNKLGISNELNSSNIPLTFTAEKNNSSITLFIAEGDVDVSGLQYRLKSSDSWQQYPIGNEIILENIGDYVQFQNSLSILATASNNYVQFSIIGKIAGSGNCQSLLNYSDTCPDYGLYGIFAHCKGLTSAPDLPATTIGRECYARMFLNCSDLIYGPKVLPATTLTEYCYNEMFQGCTSLTSAPELPATTLANYCYYSMFRDCTNLTTPPELPATTLATYCYSYMFADCTNLTTPPELPATTLANNCYSYMFNGCTGLTTAPELPATTLAAYCYQYMFSGCTSLTSAPELPATTLTDSCYSNMFEGCTNLTTPPELPATTLDIFCYYRMFRDCTNLTSAPELPATTLANYCYREMFRACRSLTSAPALPATTLAAYCYQQMFYTCHKINYIKVGFTEWHSNATNDWLNNVSTTGTFEAPRELSIEYGVSRIPTNWSLPNHQYIISVEDQKIFSKYNNEINYDIDYLLLPDTLQPTFTIVEGSLPNGLTLSSDGKISGTSTGEFDGNVVIQISCEGCESVTMTLSLTLYDAIETENNLTSNTSNELYEVSKSSDYLSYYAWKAMDGSDSTYSRTAFDSSNDGWWQIKFNEGPVILKYITGTFQAYSASFTLYLDVSNDGETFENVTSFIGGSDLIIKTDLTAPYQYYRIRNIKNNYYTQIYEIKFLYNYAQNYLRASDQKFTFTMNEESEYQIKYINTSETAATFTIIDGTLPNGISFDTTTGKFSGTATEEFEGALTIQISNTYNTVQIQINMNVIDEESLLYTPHDLTSNTSNPSFIVSQSSDVNSGRRMAYNAMDGLNVDPEQDIAHTNQEVNCWWQIQFVDGPVNVKEIYFTWGSHSATALQYLADYMLQGSNDGSTFEDIVAFTVAKTASALTTVTTNNENYYSYYRLKNNSRHARYLLIGQIEFAYVK